MGAIKKTVGALAGVSAAYALSWGITIGVETSNQSSHADVRQAQKYVSEDEQALAAYKQVITTSQYGNKCLSLMLAYSDGALSYVGYNTAVQDIANSRAQDCGSNTAEIANNLNGIEQAQSALISDQSNLGSVTHSADRSTANILTSSAETAAIVDGFLIGIIGFAAIMAADD